MTETPPGAPGDETRPVPTDRRGRVLRIALIASLTLNLVVLGLFAGAMFGHGHGARDPRFAEIGFNPFLQALPDADRAEIARALVAQAGTLRDKREAFRKDFEGLIALLRADPFDIGAVKAAVEAQQARLGEMQTLGRTLLFERIAAMTPDERNTFADSLQQVLQRGPRHRDRH